MKKNLILLFLLIPSILGAQKLPPHLLSWLVDNDGPAANQEVVVRGLLHRWTIDSTYTAEISLPGTPGEYNYVAWNLIDSVGTVRKSGEGTTISASFTEDTDVSQDFTLLVYYSKVPEKPYIYKEDRPIHVSLPVFAKSAAHVIVGWNGSQVTFTYQDQGDGKNVGVSNNSTGDINFTNVARDGYRIFYEGDADHYIGDRVRFAGLYSSSRHNPVMHQPHPAGVTIEAKISGRGTPLYFNGGNKKHEIDGQAYEKKGMTHGFTLKNHPDAPSANCINLENDHQNISQATTALTTPNTHFRINGCRLIGTSVSATGLHWDTCADSHHNFDNYKIYGAKIHDNIIEYSGTEGIYIGESHDNTSDTTYVGFAYANIDRNEIKNAGYDGGQLALCYACNIQGNTITRSGEAEDGVHRYAIILNPSCVCNVDNNTMVDNFDNIFVHIGRHGEYVNIRNNTMYQKGTPDGYMMIVNATENVVTDDIYVNIENNTFISKDGIWIAADNSVTTENIHLKYNNNITLTDKTSSNFFQIDSEFSDVSASYEAHSAFIPISDSTAMCFKNLSAGDLHLTAQSPKYHATYPSDTTALYDANGVKALLYWQGAYSTAELTYRSSLKTISSFTNPSNITVEEGVALEDLALPDTVTATLSDESTRQINVTWADDDSYDEDTPGVYTFTAVPYEPNDIDFTGATLPDIDVTVEAPEFHPTDIASCSVFLDMTTHGPPFTSIGTNTNTTSSPCAGAVTFSSGLGANEWEDDDGTIDCAKLSWTKSRGFESWALVYKKVNASMRHVSWDGSHFVNWTSGGGMQMSGGTASLSPNATVPTGEFKWVRTWTPASGTSGFSIWVYNLDGTLYTSDTNITGSTNAMSGTADMGLGITYNSTTNLPFDGYMKYFMIFTTQLTGTDLTNQLAWIANPTPP